MNPPDVPLLLRCFSGRGRPYQLKKSTSVRSIRGHRRTGRGGRGGLQPPQSLGNSVFLGSKRNLGKASF